MTCGLCKTYPKERSNCKVHVHMSAQAGSPSLASLSYKPSSILHSIFWPYIHDSLLVIAMNPYESKHTNQHFTFLCIMVIISTFLLILKIWLLSSHSRIPQFLINVREHNIIAQSFTINTSLQSSSFTYLLKYSNAPLITEFLLALVKISSCPFKETWSEDVSPRFTW